MKERIVRTVFFTLITISCILLLIMILLNIFPFNAARVYSVSVLIRSPSDRFTKGMEQAALDYNADLRIPSSVDANDGVLQIDYLQRELDNYADAVVINPEDPEGMEAYLRDERPRAPVVSVIQPLAGDSAVCHVGADDAELGRTLGEWIVGESSGPCVILLPKTGFKPLHKTRLDALKEALDRAGAVYAVRYADASAGSISAGLGNEPYRSLAVVDENLLSYVCGVVSQAADIYGAGYTGLARPYLESGRIKALAVYSDYDAGYLSVRAAVEAAEKKAAGGAVLTVYKVTAGNMYQEPIVNVLFPIG